MIYLLTPNCHPEHREGSRVHPLLAAQPYRDPTSLKLLWMTNANYQLSTKKLSTKKMENEKKSVWSKILKVVITVLTAIATTFGLQACM